jgi:hypothetical protein
LGFRSDSRKSGGGGLYSRHERKLLSRLRFPVFWQWLRHNGSAGIIKIPMEQFEEIVAGTGGLVDWLNEQANSEALLFAEEADPDLVAAVTADGYRIRSKRS